MKSFTCILALVAMVSLATADHHEGHVDASHAVASHATGPTDATHATGHTDDTHEVKTPKDLKGSEAVYVASPYAYTGAYPYAYSAYPYAYSAYPAYSGYYYR